jgi:hypothetical protein
VLSRLRAARGLMGRPYAIGGIHAAAGPSCSRCGGPVQAPSAQVEPQGNDRGRGNGCACAVRRDGASLVSSSLPAAAG